MRVGVEMEGLLREGNAVGSFDERMMLELPYWHELDVH